MADMSEDKYYRSLTRSIVLIIIVVSCTPLLLIAAIAGYQFQTAYKHKVMDHLAALVERHRENIDSFLREKLADIRVIGSIYSPEQLSDERVLENLLQSLQEHHGGTFVDLGFVNEEGVQVAYAGPFKLRRVNYADAQWFLRAMSNPYTISDVFLGVRGLPHFIVAIRVGGDGASWILRSTIDFVHFNRLVENLRVGKTGHAVIINRDGELQTQSVDKPALLPEKFVDLFEGRPEQTISLMPGEGLSAPPGYESFRLERHPDVKIFEDRNPTTHSETIYLATVLKNGDWILVFQQSVHDAFRDLYEARSITVGLIILSACMIGGMAVYLARRTVKRIVQADREKEMMNEQIIEAGKLASVGELAAGIAHEINNPVAIMVEEAGWVEDLLEELRAESTETLEEVRRALTQIKTQGARCKEITHKLLSFARRTDPKVQVVSINELVQEVVGLSEQRARFANIRIRTHLTPELPPIAVSPSEMQQVLLNLINNAIDAMERKGGAIDITTRLEDGFLVVDVADTGEGIPKANLQRIFDPFFTTKPVGKGTGLGLSICYGIVKKMGGDITVNSAVGLGTTFHIHLPVAGGGSLAASEPDR